MQKKQQQQQQQQRRVAKKRPCFCYTATRMIVVMMMNGTAAVAGTAKSAHMPFIIPESLITCPLCISNDEQTSSQSALVTCIASAKSSKGRMCNAFCILSTDCYAALNLDECCSYI